MNILIVDDEPLARNELHYLLDNIPTVKHVEEAENISETLEHLLYASFDAVFLDINLMDESGIDLAEKIKKMQHAPYIIFATAHDTFAVKAFELNATDYILKPFEQQRIEQTIEKIARTKQYVNSSADQNKLEPQNHQNINTHTKQTVLPIEVDERIHVLNVEDIVAVTVNNGITTIHSVNQDYQTSEKLNYYEKKLPTTQFLKIHRSTIINKLHIKTVEHWFNYTYQLTMTSDIKLQVSRSYMKTFKQEIGID
ncbi:response regulator transcription factor LytR [Staphylococcus sp. HMSC070D07]|uniref:response regulator transcription factor LytR n=1 Tax=Staphylococcus sp. HMSC070D07 TaxID=1715168 RepID=UPI0008AA28AA|nr:response regulator transcription factor LytR [Staphylococcus sp. HMSC070D07]OHQ46985.1 DNA-binding response regulator [Staphylococcus sp. HMSC070D07]